MSELKFDFKRSKLVPLGFLVVTLIIFAIWMWIRGRTHELIFVANIFLPFLIIFGLLGAVLQFFVISKLYYIKLTDDSMVIYRVFPKTFKYSEIKKLNYADGMLKGVDTGMYMPWPIMMKLEKSQEFLDEFNKRYNNILNSKVKVKENLL